eukprot:1848661-Rhodomonas_salina.2
MQVKALWLEKAVSTLRIVRPAQPRQLGEVDQHLPELAVPRVKESDQDQLALGVLPEHFDPMLGRDFRLPELAEHQVVVRLAGRLDDADHVKLDHLGRRKKRVAEAELLLVCSPLALH